MHFPSDFEHLNNHVQPQTFLQVQRSNLYNLSAATGSFLAFNVSPHDQTFQTETLNFNKALLNIYIYIIPKHSMSVCTLRNHNNHN